MYSCFYSNLDSYYSQAQLSMQGYILDEMEQPHSFVQIYLEGADGKWNTQTSENGYFKIEDLNIGSYDIHIISAYGIVIKKVKLMKSVDFVLTVPRTVKMNEVVVQATRVDQKMPFAYDDINKEEINAKNLGQDVPYLLKWTPSTVVTSDARHRHWIHRNTDQRL